MNRSYFNWLILIACAGLILALFSMNKTKEEHITPEIVTRPVSPFRAYISGVGIVEASSENIYIGSPLNRIVSKVAVSVGEKVKKGQILFQLEALDLNADLQAKHIAYINALVNLQKLEALPRKEDLLSASADLKSAEIEFTQAASLFQRVDGLQLNGAMSAEDVAKRQYDHQLAEAKLTKAQADFDKVKAGVWVPDLEIAQLQAQLAKAEEDRIHTEIQRTTVTAPIDATVLQIKIHEGEFPPSDPSRTPSMIIGNTDILHVRVSINQFDAPFFDRKAPAIAYLQGNAQLSFPLQFVRLEPFFVPKQNLTNDITEKVDTRVLQAIYSFQEGTKRVFVGQQMDVFIETPSSMFPK